MNLARTISRLTIFSSRLLRRQKSWGDKRTARGSALCRVLRWWWMLVQGKGNPEEGHFLMPLGPPSPIKVLVLITWCRAASRLPRAACWGDALNLDVLFMTCGVLGLDLVDKNDETQCRANKFWSVFSFADHECVWNTRICCSCWRWERTTCCGHWCFPN